MDEVRIAIVGAGANTRERHIPNLRAIEGVEIVGVVNRSRGSSETVARACEIPRVYNSWTEALADPGVDAVLIGTWPNSHCDIAVAALAAQKHVLCESRMSRTAAEARIMLKAAQAHPHLVAQLVPGPATLRVDQTVKRLLSENWLGEVMAVDVNVRGKFVEAATPLHWRQDVEAVGVNIMLLGVWYECVARWIGTAVSVTAVGSTNVKTRRDGEGHLHGVSVPDHVDVVASMACGAQAHFQVSAVAGLAPTEAWLFGKDATLQFRSNQLFGGSRNSSSLELITIPPEEEGRWRVEEEFIDAVRGQGVVSLTTFADGARNMEFNEAVVRSMRAHRTIDLPLL
jgi:predicted dehydrogenase